MIFLGYVTTYNLKLTFCVQLHCRFLLWTVLKKPVRVVQKILLVHKSPKEKNQEVSQIQWTRAPWSWHTFYCTLEEVNEIILDVSSVVCVVPACCTLQSLISSSICVKIISFAAYPSTLFFLLFPLERRAVNFALA